MSETPAMVVDADGHVCEPADLWEKNLPAHLHDDGIRLRWNAGTGYDECWVEDGMATDRGLVGLGNAGMSFADVGRGMHYEEINLVNGEMLLEDGKHTGARPGHVLRA